MTEKLKIQFIGGVVSRERVRDFKVEKNENMTLNLLRPTFSEKKLLLPEKVQNHKSWKSLTFETKTTEIVKLFFRRWP